MKKNSLVSAFKDLLGAVRLGITQMSAESRTQPGGYAEGDKEELEQFAIHDDRPVGEVAAAKSCKASQVALAWVLSRGDDVVPIPGTKRMEYLEQNAAAAEVVLTADELRRLDEALPPGAAAGSRYPEPSMRFLSGLTPPR